jgi:hypothetical protein
MKFEVLLEPAEEGGLTSLFPDLMAAIHKVIPRRKPSIMQKKPFYAFSRELKR